MVFIVKSKRFGDQIVKIDDEDRLLASKYHWSVRCEKSTLNLVIYTRVHTGVKKTRSLRLDQLVLGIEKMPFLADIIHIDDDSANCQKANLRYFGKKPEEGNNAL